ncbi:MAG: hypothetical protein ACUVWK_05865 [Nitrososphaerales archaeon]
MINGLMLIKATAATSRDMFLDLSEGCLQRPWKNSGLRKSRK